MIICSLYNDLHVPCARSWILNAAVHFTIQFFLNKFAHVTTNYLIWRCQSLYGNFSWDADFSGDTDFTTGTDFIPTSIRFIASVFTNLNSTERVSWYSVFIYCLTFSPTKCADMSGTILPQHNQTWQEQPQGDVYCIGSNASLWSGQLSHRHTVTHGGLFAHSTWGGSVGIDHFSTTVREEYVKLLNLLLDESCTECVCEGISVLESSFWDFTVTWCTMTQFPMVSSAVCPS